MMRTTRPLFHDIPAGAQEAPQRILEAERFACNYWAVLKKRFGCITADDFLRCAHRFVVLCDEIYRGSNIELRKNKDFSLDSGIFADGIGEYEGGSGEVIDVSQLDANSFRKIFEHASSMVLNIRPKVERDDIRSSFSQIEWARSMAKKIFLYSQDGGRHDLKTQEYHRGPLHDLLLRKMFCADGVAPSINFGVRLGIAASLDEARKKF